MHWLASNDLRLSRNDHQMSVPLDVPGIQNHDRACAVTDGKLPVVRRLRDHVATLRFGVAILSSLVARCYDEHS